MNIISRARLAGRCLLACVLATPLAHTLRGQTLPANQLEEFVVTARRVAENSVDVPAYTQVISGAQIQQSNATNLIELLEDEANLDFTSLSGSPTNTQVSLRGTGVAGNGRTLVLLDGIRTNRVDMGEFNWLQFSLQDIASIEVVQGPQGAFYGDNAVGGVIKINTLGEPTASGGNAQLLVGNNGVFKAAAGYTELAGDLWSTLTGGYNKSDGWRDQSGYNSKSASLGLGYDNHHNSVTRLNASFLDNNYDQPGYLTLKQLAQDPTQAGSAASNGWSDYRRVSMSNEYGATATAKVLTDAGASFVKEYYDGFGTQFNRSMKGYFVSPKVHFEQGAFTFTPGIDWAYDWLHVVTTTPVDSTLIRRTLSPYLTAEWRATDTVALSAAYRHESNSIDAREQTSSQAASRTAGGNAVQLAVNYKPRAGAHLYAKYDHTYRFPATDEISYYQGFGGGPNYNEFFNPNLQPEVSDNYEIGADYAVAGWNAGASVYRLTTKDEIFYNVMDNLNENLAETRRTGAQLNGGYDNGTVGLRARLDYVDAQLTRTTPNSGLIDRGPLRMTPTWHCTTTAVVRPCRGVELSVTQKIITGGYVDDSYAGNAPGRVGGVGLLDARLSYRPTDRWRLFAGVNNLFDRTYVSYATIGYPPPNYAPTTVVYPAQGRALYFGSSVMF
ncbi:MAG: TonB-dependent receptor [Opitutales bacterium]